jgi:hypothetical protein
MKPRNSWIAAVAMIGLALLVPPTAWAGGMLAEDDHDDDQSGDKTAGPYGFVKDTRGSVVADATVTVDIKDRGQLVTQTNILGAYRIPTFGIGINPDDVTISCKKEGYKQVNVVQRLGMADPKAGFEVECTMQKQ